MAIEIEIETWPEPDAREGMAPPAEGRGRWRLLQVVLSEHDAGEEQVERMTREGWQGA